MDGEGVIEISIYDESCPFNYFIFFLILKYIFLMFLNYINILI